MRAHMDVPLLSFLSQTSVQYYYMSSCNPYYIHLLLEQSGYQWRDKPETKWSSDFISCQCSRPGHLWVEERSRNQRWINKSEVNVKLQMSFRWTYSGRQKSCGRGTPVTQLAPYVNWLFHDETTFPKETRNWALYIVQVSRAKPHDSTRTLAAN